MSKEENSIGILDPASPEGCGVIDVLEERSAAFGTSIERRSADATPTLGAPVKVA